MKRIPVVTVLAAFALVCASLAVAGTGTRSASANPGNYRFGPFPSTSPDNGTCQQAWAMDTFDRFFLVHDNGDGTFNVTEQFKNGTFVTLEAPSPGACESTPHHGASVVAGISGRFQGFLSGTVTSSTFNPQACTPATCNTTSGFLLTVFGPEGNSFFASESTFNFEYSSSDKRLIFHHWQDKSDGQGGEKFEGDIATN